jgi:hypothetical protein
MECKLRMFMFFSIVSAAILGCGSDTPGGGDGGDGGPACTEDGDCPGGFCVNGECVECRVGVDCEEGEVCQDGRCVEGCPMDDRCESGGTCCPGDYECIDRVCRQPCDGVRCGHRSELCCGAGQVCEDERCLVDCGANQRCGRNLDECCQADEICYGFSCTAPQADCRTQSDCPPDQVCEVDLGKCLDREVVGDCEYHPPEGVFNPEVEWQWNGSATEPDFDQIMMAPAVANLTDDNGDQKVDQLDIPDVVFINFHSGGAYNDRGVLRVVSGDGSANHLNLTAYNTHPGSCPALGDLDGDSVPEIVVDKQLDANRAITGTYAFHADGSLYWEAPGTGCATGGPAIADLNADGFPEVITRDAVLTHDGAVVCNFTAGSSMPVAADVDLDGAQEAVSGRGAYRGVADANGNCEVVWENAGGGHPAVANFDADPYPEIVFPYGGELVLLNHDGSQVWSRPIPLDQPRIQEIYGITDCTGSTHKACNPGGGPPTIADFDGDGEAEIGLAARWYYLVYESDGSVLWAHKTQDYSSAVTGSSVFDFEGDGKAEVVYNDELFLRVYKGAGGDSDADGDGFTDPVILVEEPNPSGTLFEYPLVVDVDADGRAEVLVAANNYAFPGFTGLRAFGDALDNWVGTRKIWNQHSYHVTNICDGIDPACVSADNTCGAVPQNERRNWELLWLNNYRQNVQGEGLFWAPDLVVINLGAVCELDMSVYITFDVMNQGSRMAPAGVPVTVYIDGTAVETVHTSRSLLPGQLEHFSTSWQLPEEMHNVVFEIRVAADDQGDGTGKFNECENGGEDNNSAIKDNMLCGLVD